MDGSNRWVCHEKSKRSRIVLISPEKETLKYAIRLQFLATNNEVEYEALLTRLSLAKALEQKTLSSKLTLS